MGAELAKWLRDVLDHIELVEPDGSWMLGHIDATRSVLDAYEFALTHPFGWSKPRSVSEPEAQARIVAYEHAVRLLGEAYAMHDGYREEWRA